MALSCWRFRPVSPISVHCPGSFEHTAITVIHSDHRCGISCFPGKAFWIFEASVFCLWWTGEGTQALQVREALAAEHELHFARLLALERGTLALTRGRVDSGGVVA